MISVALTDSTPRTPCEVVSVVVKALSLMGAVVQQPDQDGWYVVVGGVMGGWCVSSFRVHQHAVEVRRDNHDTVGQQLLVDVIRRALGAAVVPAPPAVDLGLHAEISREDWVEDLRACCSEEEDVASSLLRCVVLNAENEGVPPSFVSAFLEVLPEMIEVGLLRAANPEVALPAWGAVALAIAESDHVAGAVGGVIAAGIANGNVTVSEVQCRITLLRITDAVRELSSVVGEQEVGFLRRVEREASFVLTRETGCKVAAMKAGAGEAEPPVAVV